MYRVSKRSLSILIVVVAAVIGMLFYVGRYIFYGSTWARAPFNQSIYNNGVLNIGTVTDRNGVILASTDGGRRTFIDNAEIRKATVHSVGDREGNVGTGALRVFASELTGYNLITGSYSLSNNPGKTVSLSIDSKINAVAYDALAGRRGVVMVSNYKTGEILCMVSTPAFDPANPPDIVDDEIGIYLNRAIQSAYTPGSTFKLVTAAAAIEKIRDIDERMFKCEGEITIGSDTVTCNSTHGVIDFTQALRVSCNIAFAELALELGSDTLEQYAEKYALSKSITINGITTISGNFDHAPTDTSFLAWSGVGQYTNLVCPATMLRFTGAIANDGKAAQLTLLKKEGLSSILPNTATRLMPESTADKLGDMMEIQNRDGFAGLDIHAKSGTAQVSVDKEPHAWYVGYITNEDHPYAFVVIVENGGGGTAVAAPIASRVLRSMID